MPQLSATHLQADPSAGESPRPVTSLPDPAVIKPELSMAKQFFALKTLPRRIRDHDEEEEAAQEGKPRIIYRLASSREALHAEGLYPVCGTTADDLGQLGIGVALYFKQLIWLAGAFLIYGILNIWTIVHYATNYDDASSATDYSIGGLLPGSANCEDEDTVTLSDCYGSSSTTCEGTYRESCELSYIQGVLDLAGMGFLVVYCVMLAIAQDRAVEDLDVATQTTQDYGVVVNDPGPEDDDPDEWQKFFSQFGEVAYVTIARANAKLLRALTNRRIAKYNIRLLIPAVATSNMSAESMADLLDPTQMDTNVKSSSLHRQAVAVVAAQQHKKTGTDEITPLLFPTGSGLPSYESPRTAAAAGLAATAALPTPPLLTRVKQALGLGRDLIYWNTVLTKLDAEIAALSKDKYPVTKVYVIFNEEDGQRKCLSQLTTGLVQAAMEVADHLPAELKFKGQNVLHVEEPVEASEVIWYNLELGVLYRAWQSFVSFLLTIALIVASYYLIYWIKTSADATSLALVVSVVNSLLPYACKAIASVERHVDHGDEQDSLLFKLVCARFMNTAIINYMTTSFSDTLSETELKAVQALLWSDAIYTPTIALCNLSTTFKQNVLARFSKTQKHMNSYFLGSPWSLAERYTSMAKTVFVALFYGAIFPAGYFFAAFCFVYTFLVDRYLILRAWKKPPAYDAQLATKARMLVAVSAVVHLIVTANWFAGWPFDNTVVVDGEFEYVDKQQLDSDAAGFYFRVVPQSWMGKHQSALTWFYGWASFFVLILALVYYVGVDGFLAVMRLFKGSYKAVGDSQNRPFNTVRHIQAFVPKSYPAVDAIGTLLACHTVDAHTIHFPDLGPHSTGHSQEDIDEQNVAMEFPPIVRPALFSVVKGYLPLKLKDRSVHHHGHNHHGGHGTLKN